MSSFAAQELKARASSPIRRELSTPRDKKPFLATFKSAATFGTPPPVPLTSPSPERKRQSEDVIPELEEKIPHNIELPDSVSTSHLHLLQRQSIRWINLSFTFWSLIVLDANRVVDHAGISQFLEVMNWRAHSTITEEEFSVLYAEWMGQSNIETSVHRQRRKNAVGLFLFRQLLLEKSYVESDLDLFIGIAIHETNMRLVNSSISFESKYNSASRVSGTSLEFCTPQWLASSEELFFALDIAGYGILRFDEIFFFCSCITIGLRSWSNEQELEADLSLAILTAATLQVMRDAGASVMLSYVQSNSRFDSESFTTVAALASLQDQHNVLQRHNSSAAPSPSSRFSVRDKYLYGNSAVTLNMLKRFLIKRSINTVAMNALVLHVKACIEQTARLTKDNATELFDASTTIDGPTAIGSPRLWQQAVLTSSGFDSIDFTSISNGNIVNKNPLGVTKIPPVLLFLMSDAERLLPGRLRGCESHIDGAQGKFISEEELQLKTRSSPNNPETAIVLAANEELHETVFQLWLAFRDWGNSASKQESSPVRGRRDVDSTVSMYVNYVATGFDSNLPRDPVYQLILAVILRYKSLQFLLCAAMFDVTANNYGIAGVPDGMFSAELSVACANIMPNCRSMLIAIGYGNGEQESLRPIISFDENSPRSTFQETPRIATIAPLELDKRRILLANSSSDPKITKSVTVVDAMNSSRPKTDLQPPMPRRNRPAIAPQQDIKSYGEIPTREDYRSKLVDQSKNSNNSILKEESSDDPELQQAKWAPLYQKEKSLVNNPNSNQAIYTAYKPKAFDNLPVSEDVRFEKGLEKKVFNTEEELIARLVVAQSETERNEIIEQLKLLKFPLLAKSNAVVESAQRINPDSNKNNINRRSASAPEEKDDSDAESSAPNSVRFITSKF